MSENVNLTYNELTHHHLSTAQVVDGIQILDEKNNY